MGFKFTLYEIVYRILKYLAPVFSAVGSWCYKNSIDVLNKQIVMLKEE